VEESTSRSSSSNNNDTYSEVTASRVREFSSSFKAQTRHMTCAFRKFFTNEASDSTKTIAALHTTPGPSTRCDEGQSEGKVEQRPKRKRKERKR
jgi:hypothetical protein